MEKTIISDEKFLEIISKLEDKRPEISKIILDEYKYYWEVINNGGV